MRTRLLVGIGVLLLLAFAATQAFQSREPAIDFPRYALTRSGSPGDCLSFADYLAKAPSVRMVVERNIMGQTDHFDIVWVDGDFVMKTSRGEPVHDLLGAHNSDKVLCLVGTNYWDATSKDATVLVGFSDAFNLARLGPGSCVEAWQLLNCGLPRVPFGAVHLRSDRWSHSNPPFSHSGVVRLDHQNRIQAMEDTITAGTNAAIHRYTYEYAVSPNVPPWFPTAITLSIQARGQSEVTNCTVWRVHRLEILSNTTRSMDVNPRHYIAPSAKVEEVFYIRGVGYLRVNGRLMAAEDLDVFTWENTPWWSKLRQPTKWFRMQRAQADR